MTMKSEELHRRARQVVTTEPEAALELYDQALSAVDATPGGLATILKDKAVTLCLLGRTDQALALFNQVILDYQHSSHSQEKAAVDKSLYNKAVLLNDLGSKDEAIFLYDKIAARNTPSANIESKRLVAEAVFGKANIINRKGTEEALAEAIACYELVVRTRDKSDDLILMDLTAKSLLCDAFARLAIHRGFVQTVSWWSRRSIFKRLDQAIILLAESPHDNDSFSILASRAIAMKVHFLGLFGKSTLAERCKKLDTVARKFGAARARKIIAFMEAERNLQNLATFSGAESMGIVLAGDESAL